MAVKRSTVLTASSSVFVLALFGCAQEGSGSEEDSEAVDFPSQRIEVIVPWGAGGGTDQVVRQLTQAAEQDCEWDISVTNADGAGGATGHSRIAQAQPDGHTIGAVDTSLVFYAPSERADLTPADFKSIMQFNTKPTTFGISSELPYEDINEFLDAAKSETFSVAVDSIGGGNHIAAVGLARAAGVEFDYVAYAGGAAEAIQGLLSGEVDIIVADDAELLTYVDDGQIRSLAVMTDERTDALPDTPTLQESGVDWTYSQWRGLAAPLDTPDAIVEELGTCFTQALENETFVEFMDANRFVITHKDAKAFAEYMGAEAETASELFASLEQGS